MWNKLSMKDRAKYIALGVNNGITSLDEIKSVYNKYAEGGLKDSWKPWYWFTPEYEAPTLKEALFKAMNNGLQGENIIYKGGAYKVALNEADTQEYNIRKQQELNRNITDEEVADTYMNNVLYTMENPKDIGLKNGKYYPYADSSSPLNIGPGINYTSSIGKSLDYSGNKGYTKEKLNTKIKPDLLDKMKEIRKDLHEMYGTNADTMSLGNRLILLDKAYNVKPKGSKRANMPKAWPNLVDGMMSGDIDKIYRESYSGSKRRQDMLKQLIYKNTVNDTTVKNK